MYAVQGLWVAGAVEIFHLFSPLLHSFADGAHQGRFPDAGTALEDDQIVEILRPAEAGKQVLKSLAAVGAQEKMGRTCHGFSSQLIGFSLHNMRRVRPVTVRQRGKTGKNT